MVDKFNTIATEIIKEKGDLGLFAVLVIDSISDSSVVILSADWVGEGEAQQAAFKYVLDKLKAHLSQSEQAQITRMGIFKNSEHLIQLLSKYKAGSILRDEQVNGFQVKEGNIIYSSLTVDNH